MTASVPSLRRLRCSAGLAAMLVALGGGCAASPPPGVGPGPTPSPISASTPSSTAGDAGRVAPAAPTLLTVTHRQPAGTPDGGMRIELLAVKDSRCPVEVQCVWAGLAVVTLRVTAQVGTSTVGATVALGTPAPPALAGPGSRAADVGGFSVELAGLTPAASQRKPPALDDYVATVRLTTGPGPAPTTAAE